MTFSLHSQLAKDTLPIGDLPVCRVLLMNNRHFPWLILVPRRDGMRELFDLAPDDYQTALGEVRQMASLLRELTQAHKINIAALGNQVEQLHIHIIARFTHDKAWPNPVWNSGITAENYTPQQADPMLETLRNSAGLRNITKM